MQHVWGQAHRSYQNKVEAMDFPSAKGDQYDHVYHVEA